MAVARDQLTDEERISDVNGGHGSARAASALEVATIREHVDTVEHRVDRLEGTVFGEPAEGAARDGELARETPASVAGPVTTDAETMAMAGVTAPVAPEPLRTAAALEHRPAYIVMPVSGTELLDFIASQPASAPGSFSEMLGPPTRAMPSQATEPEPGGRRRSRRGRG